MKDIQCYELFGGIALKNHAFSFVHFFQRRAGMVSLDLNFENFAQVLPTLNDGEM